MATTQKQTRRRGAVLLAAIHEATRAELAECGYAGVTYDGVARRAQVGKTVLYRRYRTRPELVVAAIAEQFLTEPLTTSTGSLREDLRQILSLIIEPSKQLGPATFRAMVGEADDELVAHLPGMNGEPLEQSLKLATGAAQVRGELGTGPLPETALRMPIEYFRSVSLRYEVSQDDVDHLVDDVILPLYTHLTASELRR